MINPLKARTETTELLKFSKEGGIYEKFDSNLSYSSINVDLLLDFPVQVNIVKYYAFYNFAAEFGGINALIQSILAFLVSTMIYSEYAKFMAKQIHRKTKISQKLCNDRNGKYSLTEIQDY